MSTYVLSVACEQDLDDVWEYIARDSLDAADRWVGKLFETFEMLAQRPGKGHAREDLTSLPVLFWVVGAYLVVYRRQSSSIEIVAVTHGARHVPAFSEAACAIETLARSGLQSQNVSCF